MTKDEAVAWLHLFLDTPDELKRTCGNGHKECSTEHMGECSDIVMVDIRYAGEEQRRREEWRREYRPLLPAQRRAADKAQREMGDEGEGC